MTNRSFKKLFSSFLLVSMLVFSLTSAIGSAAVPSPVQLTDIVDSYAQKEINNLVDNGIISGYEDGSFQPRKTITRAELSKIIVLSSGLKENPEQAAAFTDVGKDSWYRGFVGALVASNITQGTSATTFAPEAKVTREELAIFFIRALGLEETTGKVAVDAKLSDLGTVSSWAQPYVSLAFKTGFTLGSDNPDGTIRFSPKDNSERQAVARMAYEFMHNKNTFINRAKELVNNNPKVSSVIAINNSTIEVTFTSPVTKVAMNDFTFDNNLEATRAELKAGTSNVIVLTTSMQTLGTVYKLMYLGSDTGITVIGANSQSNVGSSSGNTGSSNSGSNSNGSGSGSGSGSDSDSDGNSVVTPVVLSAPANFTASAGDTQIHLAWLSVTGATYYNLYQSLDNSTYTKISGPATVTTATYNVTGLTNGTTYYFKTTAANTGTVSMYSNVVSATPTATPLIAPSQPVLATANVVPEVNITISAPLAGVTAWLAPAGTTTFTPSTTMTRLVGNGTATTIAAPAAAGIYKLFLVNAAGTSLASEGSLTVSIPLVGPAIVDLGTAGNFVILSKAGITNVPTSAITGDIGVSPIDWTAITGFSLIADATNEFSRSPQINGKAFGANNASPTPSNLTTAISNMETAFVDATGRPADYLELYSGDISGRTLAGGIYKWSTDVNINSDVTLNGGANDVWIFQSAGKISEASGIKVILTGGAQAKNVFWQAAGTVSIGTGAHFEGIVLSKTDITMKSNASIKGRLLAQTGITLDQNTVTAP
ncbi:ice-binding family protein [Paenibacillus sp. FSL H7-0331]|uniref:ice-binding family protein n=1 Tax=Paenibacillus sp. FSL H7-0331 TaxID=1920421 RepID=UPI00096E8B2C|nr:ice-binding family protein [Paenibacillus sp. FSL H7-0331]OMF18748.1 hypothetical protein BK127_09885 [Paenibacillus sp. FSL H7-0331]